MTLSVEAVYENGVLRPLEPLDLAEHQHVHVTIAPAARKLPDEWVDHEFIEYCKRFRDDTVTVENVRRATASIPGLMSQAVREDRDDH
jgi:predicted DNA-binding antitoxin AbrB/MazE fold protein